MTGYNNSSRAIIYLRSLFVLPGSCEDEDRLRSPQQDLEESAGAPEPRVHDSRFPGFRVPPEADLRGFHHQPRVTGLHIAE